MPIGQIRHSLDLSEMLLEAGFITEGRFDEIAAQLNAQADVLTSEMTEYVATNVIPSMRARLLSMGRYEGKEDAINLFTDVIVPMFYDEGEYWDPKVIEGIFAQFVDSGYADTFVELYNNIISTGMQSISEAMESGEYDAQSLLAAAQTYKQEFEQAVSDAFGIAYAMEIDFPWENTIESLDAEIEAYNEAIGKLGSFLYNEGLTGGPARFKDVGYNMSSQIQMITDGLIEMVDAGQIDKANEVIASLLDSEALQEHTASGETISDYIVEVFKEAGVEVQEAASGFADFANDAKETVLEAATNVILDNGGLKSAMQEVANGRNLFTVFREMAEGELSKWGDDFTDADIDAVALNLATQMLSDVPEAIKFFDAETGKLKEGMEEAFQEWLDGAFIDDAIKKAQEEA